MYKLKVNPTTQYIKVITSNLQGKKGCFNWTQLCLSRFTKEKKIPQKRPSYSEKKLIFSNKSWQMERMLIECGKLQHQQNNE